MRPTPPAIRPVSPGAAVFLSAALCPTPASLWGTARVLYEWSNELVALGAVVGLESRYGGEAG